MYVTKMHYCNSHWTKSELLYAKRYTRVCDNGNKEEFPLSLVERERKYQITSEKKKSWKYFSTGLMHYCYFYSV